MGNACCCFESVPSTQQERRPLLVNKHAQQNSHSIKNLPALRPLAKELTIQLSEMGPEYWRDKISDWIDDNNEFDIKYHNKQFKTNFNDSIGSMPSHSDEWQTLQNYIKSLWKDIQKERGYNDDQWDIIKHVLWNEWQHDIITNIKSPRCAMRVHKHVLHRQKSSCAITAFDDVYSDSSSNEEEKEEPVDVSTEEACDHKNLCIKYEMREFVKNKNVEELHLQSADDGCCRNIKENDELFQKCECLQRLCIVMKAYNQSSSTKSSKPTDASLLWMDAIRVENKYEIQQLVDDFTHVQKIHIDADNELNRSRDHKEEEESTSNYCGIALDLCKKFKSEYQCSCVGNIDRQRALWRYSRYQIRDEDMSQKDVIFGEKCEQIHKYFYHSTIQFGTEAHQTTAKDEQFMDNQMEQSLNAPSLKRQHSDVFSEDDEDDLIYVGKKEDKAWWKEVRAKDDEQTQDDIYHILLRNMGVFRWQNPHGFQVGKNREISHYKPKFKDIKEEVLQNDYVQLSPDSWNRTLEKSKVFWKSWARKKIKTKTKSFYNDQIAGYEANWEAKEDISTKEIITLKLYTDFNDLQCALKKCFRYEMMSDMFNIHMDTKRLIKLKTRRNIFEDKQAALKNRLQSFYHWRGGLMIVLHKFGTMLNGESNRVLYHGVNSKMLIRASQTLAFHGPLSTSSSYHVARTFATNKGMVLKITSHFPRLNYCKAFDASSLSDYPEEQEWLVAFMYCRVLEVRTRKLSLEDLRTKMPIASLVREEFFAIHLFKEQIFSMGEHLQQILVQYLKVNRKQCCDVGQQTKYKKQDKCCEDWPQEYMMHNLCDMMHKQKQYNNKYIKGQKKKRDHIRRAKICPVLCQKFDEFRAFPNLKQRIKFDTISDDLKRFFMNYDIKDNKWRISFEEITNVYPNAEEIHFINHYKFCDKVLADLLRQIQKRKGNKRNRIKKISFLYYNYKATANGKPLNNTIFQDPSTLREKLKRKLTNFKWKIKCTTTGRSGYKIRVFSIAS